MNTPEEIQTEIDRLVKKRNEMMEHGGLAQMATAVKYQDRIDGYVEKKKEMEENAAYTDTSDSI